MLSKLRPQLFAVLTCLLLALPQSTRADTIYVTYNSNTKAGTIGEYNASTGVAINTALVTGLSARPGRGS